MQLIKSVCIVLFKDQFSWEQFPICFLVHDEEIRLAELLLTYIANSFSWEGGGVNSHQPGINNSSADMSERSVADAREFWKDRVTFRQHQGFWEKSRQLEQADLEKRATATEAPRKKPGWVDAGFAGL
jgi:hypothetical protein